MPRVTRDLFATDRFSTICNLFIILIFIQLGSWFIVIDLFLDI